MSENDTWLGHSDLSCTVAHVFGAHSRARTLRDTGVLSVRSVRKIVRTCPSCIFRANNFCSQLRYRRFGSVFMTTWRVSCFSPGTVDARVKSATMLVARENKLPL